MLKNREKSIITTTETFALMAFITLMLVIFYPKNSIQKYIEDENTNYDLSVIYLENIIKAYPDKKDNYLKLAKIYLKMGELKKSQQMLSIYNKNSNQTGIDTTSYKLLKSKYQKNRTSKLKNQLKDKLFTFLATDRPTMWYFVLQEAKSLELKKLTLLAHQKRIFNSNSIDDDEIVESYFLAKELNLTKNAESILLNSIEKKSSTKLLELYKQHFESQKKFQILGDFFKKRYEKSLDKEDFFKTVDYYFLNKSTKQALEFMKKYENNFINSDKDAEKIINIYLANRHLKKARDFSLKVMKIKSVL